MKTYGITRYTGPIEVIDRPEAQCGPTEVLIELAAASINPIDALIAAGKLKAMLKYDMPLTLGHDGAGRIIAVGSEVHDLAVGDEVYTRVPDGHIGTFAPRIAVEASAVARKPQSLSLVESAGIPLVALTAWQFLHDYKEVGPGTKVFIQGGSGAVGAMAIQMAKHLGAYVATTASADQAEYVRSLGADEVRDYTAPAFMEGLDGFDLALDIRGEDSVVETVSIMKRGGVIVGLTGPIEPEYAKTAGLGMAMSLAAKMMSRKVRKAAEERGVQYRFHFMRPDKAQLEQIASLIDSGVLRSRIDSIYPLDQLPQAWEHRAHGKVIMQIKD